MQTEDRACCLKTGLLSSSGTFRVLVGVTGSVAALKLPLLVSQLLQLPGVSCNECLSFKSRVSLFVVVVVAIDQVTFNVVAHAI